MHDGGTTTPGGVTNSHPTITITEGNGGDTSTALLRRRVVSEPTAGALTSPSLRRPRRRHPRRRPIVRAATNGRRAGLQSDGSASYEPSRRRPRPARAATSADRPMAPSPPPARSPDRAARRDDRRNVFQRDQTHSRKRITNVANCRPQLGFRFWSECKTAECRALPSRVTFMRPIVRHRHQLTSALRAGRIRPRAGARFWRLSRAPGAVSGRAAGGGAPT